MTAACHPVIEPGQAFLQHETRHVRAPSRTVTPPRRRSGAGKAENPSTRSDESIEEPVLTDTASAGHDDGSGRLRARFFTERLKAFGGGVNATPRSASGM
jgi:hypothetical protein